MRPHGTIPILQHLPVLVMLLVTACPAAAHEVRPAFLQITELEPDRFEVVWKQPVMTNRRLPIDPVLPDGCRAVSRSVPENSGTALIERWQSECGMRSGRLAISGLSATLTDALVRIIYLNGDVTSTVLNASRPSLELSDSTPGAAAYFLLGVKHLLLGIDHILFVAGLVLFIRVPWMLLKTVTAFTVAHSITLALSVLGLVTLPQGPVEAVIALSILFLARELMVPEVERSRITRAAPWLMAFSFGLLHGFGFAGALTSIGLPRDQLATSLLLFNVGIEAGQLGIITLILAGGWLAGRLPEISVLQRPYMHRPLPEWGFTVVMGSAAGFWTVSRVMALVS